MVEGYERRSTRPVSVGDVVIGGDHPIVMQSMATAATHDIPAVVDQIIQLHRAGAEIVRVTTPTLNDANSLPLIKSELKKRYQDVPLVADVHHQGSEIALKVTESVEKVRINPGLFVFKRKTGRLDYSQDEIDEEREAIRQSLSPVVRACLDRGVVMRIGVNHGSLAERLMVMYGDTPLGMVESALEYIKVCESLGLRDLVVSLKASRVPIMLAANRLIVRRMEEEGMRYPLHLGVTEAGNGQYARVKSSVGIGTLLAEGIGDTIRVSLSEDPVRELDVCKDLLQSLGLKKSKVEFIACPSCGRTQFDLPTVLEQIQTATGHLVGLDIAVMGCIVNGPGEMADASYGYIGKGGGRIDLYRGRQLVKINIPQDEGLSELVDLIKKDGRWVDP